MNFMLSPLSFKIKAQSSLAKRNEKYNSNRNLKSDKMDLSFKGVLNVPIKKLTDKFTAYGYSPQERAHLLSVVGKITGSPEVQALLKYFDVTVGTQIAGFEGNPHKKAEWLSLSFRQAAYPRKVKGSVDIVLRELPRQRGFTIIRKPLPTTSHPINSITIKEIQARMKIDSDGAIREIERSLDREPDWGGW